MGRGREVGFKEVRQRRPEDGILLRLCRGYTEIVLTNCLTAKRGGFVVFTSRQIEVCHRPEEA